MSVFLMDKEGIILGSTLLNPPCVVMINRAGRLARVINEGIGMREIRSGQLVQVGENVSIDLADGAKNA
jgi:hypothetical protein